jgi:hypothetical protein
MLPGGIGQAKVIEMVREQLTGNVVAEVRHVSEVRLPLLTRGVVLTEDHFALGAVRRRDAPNLRRSRCQ